MKKNKFLALTMLCSTLCGIPTKAQEIKDSGIQKVSGETDSSKKDKTPSLKKNDKQISQINAKKVVGFLWAIHETLSYFKGNFGQFYHKPARLSVVGASRWIGERRNNKNFREKYKLLVNYLRNNIQVVTWKYKLDNEDFKKIFPHGYAVKHENNLGLNLSTAKKDYGTFLGIDDKSRNAVEKLFGTYEGAKKDFLEDFRFICKYDDKEVFIGLISVPYLVNSLGYVVKPKSEEDFKKVDAAKKFLFSYTCKQLNEWSILDDSPIVTLRYWKYGSIDGVPLYENVKDQIKELELNK